MHRWYVRQRWHTSVKRTRMTGSMKRRQSYAGEGVESRPLAPVKGQDHLLPIAPQLDAACVARLRVRLDLPAFTEDELRVHAPGFKFSTALVDGVEIAATASGWAFGDDIAAGAEVSLF